MLHRPFLGNLAPAGSHFQEEQPLFRWQGLRAARFDHGGTRAAAVVYPQVGGLGEDQRYNQTWGAQVKGADKRLGEDVKGSM